MDRYNIQVFNDAQLAAAAASEALIEGALASKTSPVGLATGRTMIPVYQNILRIEHQSIGLFADTTFAQLDEILDTSFVASNFSTEIHNSLLSKLKGGYAGFIGINDLALNPFSEAERHYQNILQAGGLGVQLLGIGINGHIGFNEPGSNKNSICRVTNLAKSTIERNGYDRSMRAITLGIADILNARRLVLLATGEAKASAISSMINAPKSANNPASLLRDHPDILLFLDKAAASHLNE